MKVEIQSVLNVLHSPSYATLATQSVAMSGYPYATVVANVQDADHCPVILVSALAEHTHNLNNDPCVSVSLIDDAVALSAQEAPRLTLVADALAFEPCEDFTKRYLRYAPEAERYLMLDFSFFKLHVKAVRYIGGLGRMGWLTANDLSGLPLVSLQEEQTLLERAAGWVPKGVDLLGLDYWGIDYRADGFRRRLSWQSPGDQAIFASEVFRQTIEGLSSVSAA